MRGQIRGIEKDIKGLPEYCYYCHPSHNKVIILKRGEMGYYETDILTDNPEVIVDELNLEMFISKAQREAMFAGSLFGWHTPASLPSYYDEEGKLLIHRKRGY